MQREILRSDARMVFSLLQCPPLNWITDNRISRLFNQKLLAHLYLNSTQNTSVNWILRLLLSLLCWPKVIQLSGGHCIWMNKTLQFQFFLICSTLCLLLVSNSGNLRARGIHRLHYQMLKHIFCWSNGKLFQSKKKSVYVAGKRIHTWQGWSTLFALRATLIYILAIRGPVHLAM